MSDCGRKKERAREWEKGRKKEWEGKERKKAQTFCRKMILNTSGWHWNLKK